MFFLYYMRAQLQAVIQTLPFTSGALIGLIVLPACRLEQRQRSVHLSGDSCATGVIPILASGLAIAFGLHGMMLAER